MTEAEKSHEIQLFWFFMAHLYETSHIAETETSSIPSCVASNNTLWNQSQEDQMSLSHLFLSCVPSQKHTGEKLSAMVQSVSEISWHCSLKSLRSDA